MSTDPFDLGRFLTAQDRDGTHDRALAELRRGRKTTHWMWFVFPQLAGLGRSATARHYAIGSVDEARAYLAHPVLGARLREAAAAVLAAPGTADDVLGDVDALKLRSSATLFALVDDRTPSVFTQVLDRFFAGEPDARTQEVAGVR